MLSGSWDGIVCDWDLNTGQTRRDFTSSAGQISSVTFRPSSTDWRDIRTDTLVNGVSGGRDSGLSNGVNGSGGSGEDAPGSPAESIRSFGSLFGDDDDMGMGGEEDETSRTVTNGVGGESGSIDSGTEGPKGNSGDSGIDDSFRIHSSDSGGPTNGIHESNSFSKSANSTSPVLTEQNIFLASSMDGTLRIWDVRQPTPVATSMPTKGVPPWCMNACWSTDGNYIYAGRRNGTVEEFSLRRGISEATRTLKFPLGSGPVSALTALPNGRHLIWCVEHAPYM